MHIWIETKARYWNELVDSMQFLKQYFDGVMPLI